MADSSSPLSTNQVITFGCRLNIYESEVITDLLEKSGHHNTIVVNTCSVTNEAERQARQNIRKLRKEHPDAHIIVTGCAVQTNTDSFMAMPEINQVLGNENKMHLSSYDRSNMSKSLLMDDIMEVKEAAHHLLSGFQEKSRAFLQIQNGCNHRCTFCSIPFGRGNSRSVPVGHIVEQIRVLLEKNYKEIVFTGVDLTSYGEDLPGKPTLGQMCKRVLNLLPNLKRLRLSSLDSAEMDEDLWELCGDERVMPHLHLSLQAGDDLILKRMKRRHLSADAVRFCKRAKEIRPDMVLGADIIAGFPTETQEHFDNTLNTLKECDITYLHVFPYSPRPNTPAARMPQVDKAVIKERARILRDFAKHQQEAFFDRCIGQKGIILVEDIAPDHTWARGKSDHFAPTHIQLDPSASLQAGTLVSVTFLSHDGTNLTAQLN
jgi:threonylcarbamoyladenosine tRNA methylthiotransferase MtaB